MSTKVSIQGVKGAFHEAAAQKFFGQNISIVECETFKDVCDSLESGSSDFAVMAIENAIAGSILGNYSLIRSYGFDIIGEVYLRISMCLMALPGTKIEDLKMIQSHPIAIAQSQEYLWSLKGVKLLDVNDTADAAKEIAENQLKNIGALANKTCAALYGLEVLKEGVETNKKNFTRFLVLSKEKITFVKKAGVDFSVQNKASLNFELGHKAGSLAKVLSVLDKYSINMTKIQSVPIIGKPEEYTFYVDIECDIDDNYKQAMKEIEEKVSHLSVLGKYAKGEVISFEK